MSIMIQFGEDGDQEFAASNRGWSDFTTWTESLDAHEFEAIIHLVEHGWSEEISQAAEQLAKAIKEKAPTDKNVMATAQAVLGILKSGGDGGVALVTDGMQPVGKE